MKLDDLKVLHTKIENNEVSLEKAKEDLFTGKRSWHQEDWIERRETFLKTNCEQCGSTDNLVVQHFSHPRKYGQYKYDSINKYSIIFISEIDVEELVSNEDINKYCSNIKIITKDVCPDCGYSYRERKTMTPKFICTKCKKEFHMPERVNFPTIIDDLKDPLKNPKPHELTFSSIRQQLSKENFKKRLEEKYGYEIEKETLLKYIKDSIKYQNFEDAKKWCRTCAFNYDKNKADLCPVCKKNYKKFQYDQCRECAGIEEINFNKELKESEKNCSNCEFNMPDGNKMVCAAGSKDGPYQYGDEIVDTSKVCIEWERSIRSMFN